MAERPTATTVLEAAGAALVRIGRHGGRGCGVVVADGLVVTNAHNLRGDEVTVAFGDGRVVVGQVAASDVVGDLAVVRVDTADLAPLARAKGAAEVGEAVYAVSTRIDGGARLTSGTISAVAVAFRGPSGEVVRGALEHTAPLGRGSSGGPLLDAKGRLLGLNTHRLDDGFYLALPYDKALVARIDSLAAGETPARGGRLGVGLVPPHVARRLRRAVGLPERDGLLVRGVAPDSPAAAADLREGDLLVSAGGVPLGSVEDLRAALESADAVTIGVLRGADELSVTVTLA